MRGKSAVVKSVMIVALLGVAACGRQARVDPGPDEFLVMPASALVDPATLSDLPTPGGVSRTDRSAVAQGIVALGGNPAAASAVALGSGNTSQKTGFGFLSGLFGGGKKNAQALDPAAEAARLRALGIATLGEN